MKHTHQTRTPNRSESAIPQFEGLEPRMLLSTTLIGVSPEAPFLEYDNQGTISYDASAQALSVDATPLNFQQTVGGPLGFIFVNADGSPAQFLIDIKVDNAGNLIGGVPGDDLVVTGQADVDGDFVVDYSGVLLTGEILQFGSQDSGGPTDAYDFIFTPTGGELFDAGFYPNRLGINMTSESSTYAGDYTVDFSGGAKGTLGSTRGGTGQSDAGLGDFVWHDKDVDGIQDDNEPGIESVVVELLDAGGSVIGTTTTDNTGFYQFIELDPGTYSTRVASTNFNGGGALENFFPTLQNQGSDDAVDSDGARTSAPESDQTTLTANQFDPTLDFGFFTTGLELEKTGPDQGYPGQIVTYTFKITNTGDVPIDLATLNDPLIDPSNPLFTGTLNPGEMKLVTADYTIPLSFGTTTIDFETDAGGSPLTAGQIIDDEFLGAGITVSSHNQTKHPAMIFDSANPTGGDTDLGTPNIDFGGPGIGSGGSSGAPGENSQSLGNILIISEDGDSSDPDDNARGGKLIFTFDTPRTVESVAVIDVDHNEPGGTIKTYDASGTLLSVNPLLNLSNNSYQRVMINTDNVSRMEVHLLSSGAVADLILGTLEGKIKNTAVVTGDPRDPGDLDLPDLDAMDMHMFPVVPPPVQGIDIEKLTNGVDADTKKDAVEIAAGDTVTWTYLVTNTGEVAFTFEQVEVVDDNGTPSDSSDDFTPDFVASSDVGADGILSPGETWTYEVSAVAQALGGDRHGGCWCYCFCCPKPKPGVYGNTATVTAGQVSDSDSSHYRNGDHSKPDPASIWGHVYVDEDNDGIKDDGEEGIKNVKVKLYGTTESGKKIRKYTYTDSNGAYHFENLKPGTYKVYQPKQPRGYKDGKDTAGNLGGTAISNKDKIVDILLGSGDQAMDYNFGERPKSRHHHCGGHMFWYLFKWFKKWGSHCGSWGGGHGDDDDGRGDDDGRCGTSYQHDDDGDDRERGDDRGNDDGGHTKKKRRWRRGSRC